MTGLLYDDPIELTEIGSNAVISLIFAEYGRVKNGGARRRGCGVLGSGSRIGNRGEGLALREIWTRKRP